LVPVGQSIYQSNGLFVLNDVGAFLWDLLPEAESAEALCRSVVAAYEVEEETAMADVQDFLEMLRKLDMI
jgi:hypothetical protein